MDSNIFFTFTQILPFTGPSTARVKDKSAICIIFSENFPYHLCGVSMHDQTAAFRDRLLLSTLGVHSQTSHIEYFLFGGSGPLHKTLLLGSTLQFEETIVLSLFNSWIRAVFFLLQFTFIFPELLLTSFSWQDHVFSASFSNAAIWNAISLQRGAGAAKSYFKTLSSKV